MIADALGSVLAQTDGAGAVQTRYSYSPYGETQTSGTNDANPVQYTGRENDSTGLYYYRARYYDPQLKRFISEDPIGLGGGVNQYAYVGGNPVSRIDPLGLWTAQIGFSFSYSATFGGVGVGGTFGVGAAIDGHGNIAPYGYYGGGAALGTPGASVGVHTAASNGETICDLRDKFNNASLGGGWGPDATGDAFWGTTSDGRSVVGGGVTVGAGIGGSGFSGQTRMALT